MQEMVQELFCLQVIAWYYIMDEWVFIDIFVESIHIISGFVNGFV